MVSQHLSAAQQAAEAASGLCRAQGWQVQHPQVREALVQLCLDKPEVARAVNQPGVLPALEKCMLLGGPAKALLVLHCASLTQFSQVRMTRDAALRSLALQEPAVAGLSPCAWRACSAMLRECPAWRALSPNRVASCDGWRPPHPCAHSLALDLLPI